VTLWGWAGVGLFVLCVGLAPAEVTSAYPTSGALYYMADRLGGRRWGWYTGWLNLLGLLGAIAGIDYGAALFTGAFASIQWDFEPTPGKTVLIFIGILLLHAVLNLFGVRLVSVLDSISVWWHLAGVALIVGAPAIVPDDELRVHRPRRRTRPRQCVVVRRPPFVRNSQDRRVRIGP
jgi:amino acid transporter